MKVAVITPYYKESIDYLRECHESVINQTYECTHVMVADGFPNNKIDTWDVDHIILPKAHGDIGSTPRLIGCYHAIGLGFDAVAFLDADNCYREDHIESLVNLHRETGATFLSSSRMLCRLDGSIMARCHLTNPDKFIDTNCVVVTYGGFELLAKWVLMPNYGHLIGDRIFLYYAKQMQLEMAHSDKPTVFYRCSKDGIYRNLNEPIPKGVMPRPDYEASFRKWEEDGNPSLV